MRRRSSISSARTAVGSPCCGAGRIITGCLLRGGHDHPFQVFPVAEWPYPFERPEAARGGRVTIVGELCTPKDRLHADAETDGLRAGDIVVFEKSGAYCWTISHHDFLGHPHPEFHYLT
ncbi:type III PLP-dependent enzyme domain-containing protein [Cohnella rhizosphaerae]|uniref:Orn/DAP/Arg decarboxylase 2 C-terminal domain-containing protein n=1 Tax=Cohnella rhizosphaerae TaxID=1457232 RepID=A0A9X4QS71_9BACL|nr:hypothetical protein [Cohnella rhizosphaerae]MDG0809786.1 hypothetical protein [Cohnella rhizosphaerae]